MTSIMEKGDLNLGDMEMIQNGVKSLLFRVQMEDDHTNLSLPCICMAPRTLRDLSPNSFDPRVVSIGPLHREDENVQAFERKKAGYLMRLMRRINSPKEEILESCMEKVYASMDKIKACYVWTKKYSNAEIAEMMVMDACFILEFLFQNFTVALASLVEDILQLGNVTADLGLLENQIPFFILDELFQCTVLKFEPKASLVELILPVLRCHNIFDEVDIEIDNISTDTTHHILSLIHECYKPKDNIVTTLVVSFPPTIHSAVDLDRAGVSFKPNQNPTWLAGMEVKVSWFTCFFGSWRKPTLKMPILKVHDFTEKILRNLIAYEHQSSQSGKYITSYAYAIDQLVNTREDVSKLVNSGVLFNELGSDEEVANMINNICKEIPCLDFFYVEEWQILNKYYNSYWPKNIAWLRRTYFSSPWNIIALLAGIILFSLTVVQTIFTIKSVGSSK